jgi:hypothetical protein
MSQRIVIDPNDPVTCPDCSHEFPLMQGISHHLIERYENEYEEKLSQERDELEARAIKKAERRLSSQFQEELKELTDQLEESHADRLRIEKKMTQSAEKAASHAKKEAAEELAELRQELTQKDDRIESFRKEELQLRREKVALEAEKKEVELTVQRRIDEQKNALRSEIHSEFQLREAEFRKKIDDAHSANEELRRKLEQGSQQLQGEVLELELEEVLSVAFPIDQVQAVSKGVRGADVVQTVMLRSGSTAGIIVWEAKRAENWSNKWSSKLKDDQHAIGAEIGVLVSTVFPAGLDEPFTQHDGIWLVRPEFARPLADALRAVLIESYRQKTASAGKSEKMEALYDYICSAQFAQKVRAVLDAHKSMRDDLESEKSAMQRLWKKREGQLERITLNVVGLCGELQGISTSTLPHLDEIARLPADQ